MSCSISSSNSHLSLNAGIYIPGDTQNFRLLRIVPSWKSEITTSWHYPIPLKKFNLVSSTCLLSDSIKTSIPSTLAHYLLTLSSISTSFIIQLKHHSPPTFFFQLLWPIPSKACCFPFITPASTWANQRRLEHMSACRLAPLSECLLKCESTKNVNLCYQRDPPHTWAVIPTFLFSTIGIL